MILPSIWDFYVYGYPLFGIFLLYKGFQAKRAYFLKQARLQFIMENYYS